MSAPLAMPQAAYAESGNTPANYPPTTGSDHGSTLNNSPQIPNSKPERDFTRTPSPTPSETDILNGTRRKIAWRDLFTKDLIKIYLILIVIIVVVALVEAYHDQIINALKPVTNWLHGTRAGWLIPIVVLIALSFPPLFGHEIVYILTGLIWGLGEGFGIVAAGTIMGETCTYLVFKYCCRARGEKMELTNMRYGSLAHVVREGGLRIAIIIRYSTIPPHYTTAVFSTCGMAYWVFLTAAVLSLPKQLVIVYVGVALSTNSTKSSWIEKIIIGITVLITILAFIYVRRLMIAARPDVVYKRRKARQAKLQGVV
ncbi:hypothetical protein B0H11DRAFT_2020155 [Mycena galericulata]|nr:hypothetical protein B0H11DRAFT_2020155 [Mycena galericulata]